MLRKQRKPRYRSHVVLPRLNITELNTAILEANYRLYKLPEHIILHIVCDKLP